MPTYSYRCTSCSREFDVRQSFADAPLTVFEECGGELRKLFNSVGIVFKGSGFYRNDSRSGSSSTLSPTTTKDTAPGANSAGGNKAETKTETKAEPKAS